MAEAEAADDEEHQDLDVLSARNDPVP